MNIKICGIRSRDTAIAAMQAGATHIGINFIPTSRRYVDLTEVEAIVAAVQDTVKVVGVFQDMPIEMVNDFAVRYHLDYVQLHGSESPEYCRHMIVPVIKAIPVQSGHTAESVCGRMRLYDCALFLLDRATQGQGEAVDVDVALAIAHAFPCFVAGGLTPWNVAGTIAATHPFGVDVAGGIETDAQPDLQKMNEFVKNAR